MKQLNEVKIANLTTWTMVITICFIALFFVGFVTTMTFDLNVFTRRTSDFIFSFIGFSAVLVICSAILNISLNIGLIADSRIQDIRDSGKESLTRKFFLIVAGLVLALICFLFLGDYLTRRNEEMKLVENASDIIARYSKSVNKIAVGLSDTSKVKDIPEILNFLSSQKDNLPSVQLLVSDRFDGQLTYLQITPWSNVEQLKKPHYDGSFYKCEPQDCEYLESFFTGKTSERHFYTRDDDYRLYFPFNKAGKKFVLLFTKYERHGKMGSS